MDFTYDSEQKALRDAVRGLVGKTYANYEQRRRTVAANPGYDEQLWARLAEMGVLGILAPESAGGMGLDERWLVKLLEECGYAGLPHPIVETAAVAMPLVADRVEPNALITTDLGGPIVPYVEQWGRPIRYRYVPATWPIDAYRNAYANEPGSAEMPSAGRPVTARVITSLAARGVGVTPLVLHTGVASLEGNEMPYPERYRVPVETARRVNETHTAGHRVVAIGTTVVRALESATDADGVTHPSEGWTDLVITPVRGVRAVDGLLTGWHEPEATHLQMLEAVAGRHPLELAYPEALARGYRWHEFGDSHLLLPERHASRG